jgi:hypothetical protein
MSIESRDIVAAHPANDPGAAGALICDEVVRHALARYAGGLRAVVLTGSLARDEATVAADAGRSVVLGDAEFLLVFAEAAPLPTAAATRALGTGIEAGLRARGVACPITLSPVHARYLRSLPPHIFAYELRACGRVVWGDPNVLGLIPAFTAGEIPLEDAWRLLCNRLVELLEVSPSSDAPATVTTPESLYRTVKLYLDMATSLLVFAGAYEPTYRRRAERLQELAQQAARSDAFPFRLAPFAELVAACTGWKLCGGSAPAPAGVSRAGALERARRLWAWEVARLSGGAPDLDLNAMLEASLGLPPQGAQLRGWLHVARKCGWLRSWRLWARWARLARRGAPRYLVYSAACRALFEEGDQTGAWNELPVVRATAGALPAEIVWNYRQFLVDTRA